MGNANKNRIRTSQTNNNEEPLDVKREIMEWIIVICVAIVIAVVLNTFIIVNAIIPSASMEPTIMTGNRIFGNRLAYIKEDPKRGDIIIFRYPDNEKELFIKRIIGEPGDTVTIIEGKVYINDSDTPLDEPYLKVIPLGDYGPYEVPADSYFVMGDNRNNSADSRFWQNTFVKREKILGKAAVRYFWPPSKIQ